MVWIRRCVRLTLPLALFCLTAGVESVGAERAAISSWPTKTYYRAFAEFPSSQPGQIRITAGGAYTLYLNGDLVGADDDETTVETWDVEFDNRTNHIAVVVEHEGGATPYGLFCVLESEDVRALSSPLDRLFPWFFTGFPLPNEDGADWTDERQSGLEDYELDGQPVDWSPVQAGTLAPTAFAAFADLDLTRAPSVAGFPGGLDGSRGALRLRSLEGLNLAFGSLSEDPNIVDGDVSSANTFSRGATALLDFVETDLGRLVTIDRVRVLTRPPRSGSYEDNSLRGYSVLVSKDGVNFIEVAARNRIQQFRETSVAFPPISARTVRVVVTEFSDRDSSPQVGEVEVYGVGVVPNGTFRSPALDLGSPAAKNLDRVRWHGEVPTGADLQLRFRSGDDGSSWSAWTPWRGAETWVLDVPEPARLLQFEARMTTRSLQQGPRLDSLVVTYDVEGLPADGAAASIAPALVPIGVDTTFVYSLDVTVGAGAGVERVAVLTPSTATFDPAGIQGLGAATVDLAGSYATGDSLIIAFDPALTGDTQLEIPFRSRLLSASHDFVSLLFAPQSTNPLRAATRPGDDPVTGVPFSHVVEAETFDFPVLSSVAAVPPVLSPNGDGINDASVIGFVLGRVSAADVRVEIHELSGRRVRVLRSAGSLGAGSYLPTRPGQAGLPGAWDGLDEAGGLVPPGTYVYRVIVDLEPEDAVAVGLVAVVY